MSNWWQKWAEQVGQTLAELWLKSRSETQAEAQTHISEKDSPDGGEIGHSSTPFQDETTDT